MAWLNNLLRNVVLCTICTCACIPPNSSGHCGISERRLLNINETQQLGRETEAWSLNFVAELG